MNLTRCFLCALALLPAPVVFGQKQQQPRMPGAAPALAAATDCFATFTSGAGAQAFTFCVTQNGNVLRFESPAGVEHIRNGVFLEGYSICDHTLGRSYFDLAEYVPNGEFGAPTIVQPNGPNTLPLTITRTTWDSIYTLKQTFGRNGTDRSVTVTMSVTNNDITFVAPRTISVWRAVDWDMNGSFLNWGGSTLDSAFAWNNVVANSLPGSGGIVTTLSPTIPHTAGITSFGVGDPGCPDFGDVGRPRVDDVVAWVGHHFNVTGKNQTKTSTVRISMF